MDIFTRSKGADQGISLKRTDPVKDVRLCRQSAVSLGSSLSPDPTAGGGERRSGEPWLEDVLAFLYHQEG